MRNYFEFYEYDEVGNILRFDHKAYNGNWIRAYDYNEASLVELDKKSNRLSRTVVHPNSQQPISEPYTHDPHGNMTLMPHLQQMKWDFEDQLHYVEKGNEKIYYVYDAAGQRVRKVVEKNNNGALIEERIYLGDFEVFRRHNGNGLKLERETLHVMDDQQRVALVETRTQGNDPAPTQLIRYQYGNHLGSVCLELDHQAQIISYEEYYPYGSTSYQAMRSQTEAPKRYRYTGKERDEETGLYYHGARYYAPWLGRWVSCDPDGIEWEINLYNYASDRPTIRIDSNGRQTKPPAQLHLIEQANIDTVATNSGYSQEKTIQQYTKNMAASWGENPSDYEAGHSRETSMWKSRPGAPQKIGPQHKLANNLQSQQEALDRAAASKAGQYVRTGRKHTGAPIPNPKPVTLPNHVTRLAKQDRAQLLANASKPLTPSPNPPPSPATKPTPPEQLSLPFDKKPNAPKAGNVSQAAKVRSLLGKAAPALKTAGRALAPVARTAGKVLGPLGIGLVGYQVATAETTEEKVDAGISVVSTGLLMSKNPVAMAGGAGLAVGQLIENTLDVSSYSSSAGMFINESLQSMGANKTFSVVVGGVASVAAVPASIGVAGAHKAYQGAKWAWNKIF
jgi:RHS repeat-associated protein